MDINKIVPLGILHKKKKKKKSLRPKLFLNSLPQAGVMDRVDNIYRNTEFNMGSPISGLGFEIAEVRSVYFMFQ